jgi:hypothetical protein
MIYSRRSYRGHACGHAMALALLLLLLPPLLLTPAAEIAGGRDGQHPSLSVIRPRRQHRGHGVTEGS